MAKVAEEELEPEEEPEEEADKQEEEVEKQEEEQGRMCASGVVRLTPCTCPQKMRLCRACLSVVLSVKLSIYTAKTASLPSLIPQRQ